jgi:cytochrome c-type biogenesis protein CcmH
MNRIEALRQVLTPGKIALAASALLALGAVGWSIVRQDRASPPVQAEAGPVNIDDRIAALEERVKVDPEDAEGWLALGTAHFDLGSFADAIRAFEGATRADANSARAWSALGEARVMASQHDPMPAAALEAFKRAAAINPKDPRARYFLAVNKDLAGDHAGAIGDWLALLSDTPAGAPWEADLVRTIEQVGKINKIPVAAQIAKAQGAPGRVAALAPAIPGPSQQDLAAASAIPPSEQRKLAQGMVARLEARLKDQPDNVEGWIMLIRSRKTLGEDDRARAALNAAIAANPGSAERIRQEAAMLGVR